MILGLHDGVVVVVEVVRQHRRAGVRSERHQAAIGQRPRLGMIELAELLRPRGNLRETLLAGIGQRRERPFGGSMMIELRATPSMLITLRPGSSQKPLYPPTAPPAASEICSMNDRSPGAASVPARHLFRRRPIRIARPIAELFDVQCALLDRGGLRVGQRAAVGAHALERRLRLVGPVALRMGFPSAVRGTPRGALGFVTGACLAAAPCDCRSGRRRTLGAWALTAAEPDRASSVSKRNDGGERVNT